MNKHVNSALLILSVLLLTALLTSCGSGGSSNSTSSGICAPGVDSFVLTMNGTVNTFCEAPAPSTNLTSASMDPAVEAGIYSSNFGPTIQIDLSWEDRGHVLSFILEGVTAGTYDTAAQEAKVLYVEYTDTAYSQTSGTIVIDTLEGVGGRIKGHFDNLVITRYTTTPSSNAPLTITMSGNFDIKRDI